jgi:large subunit ribosomal protein L21
MEKTINIQGFYEDPLTLGRVFLILFTYFRVIGGKMYAIIETGSKQYRVEKDSIIDVELLGDKKKIEFDQVLLFSDEEVKEVGTPYLSNCNVVGEVVGPIKGPKEISFKYKKRKNYHRKRGHRQEYHRVRITDIKRS